MAIQREIRQLYSGPYSTSVTVFYPLLFCMCIFQILHHNLVDLRSFVVVVVVLYTSVHILHVC